MPSRRGLQAVLILLVAAKLAAVTGPWQDPAYHDAVTVPLLWSGAVLFVIWAWCRGVVDLDRALTHLARRGR